MEAKETAWQTAVERDNTPNETQRQIAVHFQESGDEALLAPYIERYLTAAETIWESKGVQRSRVVLQWMFPRTHATQAVLDRVEQWLADNPANPGAVRFVREGADDVRRALAAQKFDADADLTCPARRIRYARDVDRVRPRRLGGSRGPGLRRPHPRDVSWGIGAIRGWAGPDSGRMAA